MNTSPPPKRRRLRAPLEPDLPGEVDDDPRSRLRKTRRSAAVSAIAKHDDPSPRPSALSPPPRYAELHCLSNFSPSCAAHRVPTELFATRTRQLGYTALAITDECSLAGIVRALEASEASTACR